MDDVKRYGHIGYLVTVTPQLLSLYSEMKVYVYAADFDAQRLRADTAEAERDGTRAANNVLREELRTERLRADAAAGDANEAEQRNAELLALIEKAHTWVDRNNFGGWDAYELRDELAAALNPKPEAGSHENN